MRPRAKDIALAALALGACSNPDNADRPPKPVATADGGTQAGPSVPSGFLAPFTPPADPGGGGVLFTVSGEAVALTGYAFPPPQAGAPAFVDGWAVTFTRLLTTVDALTLSSTPDRAPGDESQTGGEVARVNGPWAVDLARSEPTYLAGKGGNGELAVPIAALSSRADGAPFATDGTRYAFGFDVIAASARAENVNLDAAALDDYKAMIDEGCAVLYVGTATFKGDKTDPQCFPPDAGYDAWPDVVAFRLCFKSPTAYRNCQNPDNDPATPFADEEHQRGIALKPLQSVVAQVTIHTDHPFWDSVLHDSPAHFDAFAARVAGQGSDGGAPPLTTLELTRGVDYTAYTDALGNKLNWRYCVEPPTDAHPKFVGPMAFDPQTVPHAANGDPASGLRDFYDFATYDQSTQGHLNSDGLCFVQRNYPSPK